MQYTTLGVCTNTFYSAHDVIFRPVTPFTVKLIKTLQMAKYNIKYDAL